MRKKILIAEKSDAIRNIAESLLHQHGYDVISSASADKAKVLIITSEPDMVIIDSSLKDLNGAYLYDLLEESEQTASIPFLIITDANEKDLSYPPEVILVRPFETDDLIEKVKVFLGSGTGEKPTETISEVDPFSTGNVDDDFLDAAFGIDSIDVESSEIIDKTTITERARQEKRKKDNTDIGIGQKGGSGEVDNNSGKVESLFIREDGSEKKVPDKEDLPDLSASSKIEIPTDQFKVNNLTKPTSPEKADNKKPGDHDYDWFINEMKKDTGNIKFEKPGNETGSQKIQVTETSDGMNPIMPSKEKKPSDKPEIKAGGVDQFISEFKQEMKQLTPESSKSIETDESGKIEPTPEIELDINQLTDFIAQKIVDQLMAKISKEDISRIIKEFLPQIKNSKSFQK